ncbi:hypothetical protein [Streptomyces sp. I05A-00742]|uniref:hypothetical protein n=1 Tax=Streptomyces sp. I05A-00742 TaxID=2732853 RepID=UPI0014881A24|nr:hypothetical protein [Streptomyces sp. I05A-00742]
MNIDWSALGQVFGISLVMTVGLVGVFTLGIVGTSPSRGGKGAPSGVVRTGAYTAFALCAAAVGYGIYLIVA